MDGWAATASSMLSAASMVAWLFAQLPQVWTNYRLKSCEGIALPFLMSWFTGDFLNLAGCVLTDQLPFQKYIAYYFVLIDSVLLYQYSQYGDAVPASAGHGAIRLQEDGDAVESSRGRSLSRDPLVPMAPVSAETPRNESRSRSSHRIHLQHNKRAADFVYFSVLALFFTLDLFPGAHAREDLVVTPGMTHMADWSSFKTRAALDAERQLFIGRISAWLCTSLYITSRMPQIWKNFTRKSVQGLSVYLFVMAFIGNATYVGSILLASDADGLREALPFLFGSGGTLLFDVLIIFQAFLYAGEPPVEPVNSDPILPYTWHEPHVHAHLLHSPSNLHSPSKVRMGRHASPSRSSSRPRNDQAQS